MTAPTDFLIARIADTIATVREIQALAVTSGLQPDDPREPSLRLSAYVLGECEAKRRIIELHQPRRQHPEWVAMGQLPSCAECGSDAKPRVWPCETISDLALPYADHPDYDEAWRP